MLNEDLPGFWFPKTGMWEKKQPQNCYVQNGYKILKCSTIKKTFVSADRDLHVISL